jgi:hypothetical protein
VSPQRSPSVLAKTNGLSVEHSASGIAVSDDRTSGIVPRVATRLPINNSIVYWKSYYIRYLTMIFSACSNRTRIKYFPPNKRLSSRDKSISVWRDISCENRAAQG